ncbi:tape measure protein [Providencia rettgeri]|uniref:tape measure protein n=1 Tax=Providencia rettgeri TaxID=587 RepID=UPI001CFD656A|nr:tape measure protein [Providencia rettgeri]EIU7557620.1 tape measure protein [Providencia rettgeri]MCB4841469.1 tape measure protein [Providencia rettgeri]
MSEQTSRLAIILDSTGAKRSSDTLATSLERLTVQGEKATGSTDELGFSFKRLATSAAGALSIGIVIKTVDEWGQVAARMKNALKSVEGDIKNYAAIQERFLTISNRNGKDIADTQLLYIGSATAMQELGYSTTQTVDYIESLSSAMTANASSVNEVLSMQNALNKAQIAGKVAGENWNSIMNATPTLLGDIAKELEKQNGGIKVTEMEVKKLAADGKISFKLFADAVMAAKDANNALADSMDNTVADGLTRVTNSAKAYYGELNQSLGITRAISASLATVSDNFGSVSTVLTGIVGIGAARYFGNLSNSIYDSTKKGAENALTNRKLAVDKVNAARATLIQAQNERAAAIASMESTKAQQAAATTEVQRISLKTQLANQTAVLTAATKAEAVATTELAAAQGRLSVANNLVKGGLALVGGPIGLAMLAAGGMYSFASSMQQAKEDAIALSRGLDGLIDKLKEMTREQKLIKIGELENSYTALESAIRSAEQAKAEAFRGTFGKVQAIEKETIGTREHTKAVEEAERAQRKYEAASASLSVAKDDLSRAQNTVKVIQADLNGTLQQGADLLRAHTQTTLPNGAAAFRSFGSDVGAAANALGKFNAASLQINFSDGGARLKKQLERDLALAKKTGEERARLQAKYAAEDAGETDERAIGNLQDLAALVYKQNEAQKKLTKSQNTTYSESAAQKLIGSLKEQQAVLSLQSKTNDKLGSQEQARAKFLDEIAQIKGKKQLTADQKSLLANEALIKAEFDKNVQLEQYIKNREAEVKIAAYNKQLMEETAQAQRAYNIELQGAGIGNLARSRLQERLRLEEEYQKKQAALTAQYNDASSGITQEMYEKETQVIKGELDKRILMMQGYHAEQDALRENWQMGIKESLLNYIDEATNYNQIAADSVTNILNSTTSAISAGFTDMINGTESVGDAFSDMASGMGQAVIQQLTQMAAQWLVYQAVQMMVSKTTQSSASAGLTANAQAASQMAGLNAYASTAAIPIFGPAMAPAAMAAAITATQPLALTISALSTAGLTGMAHSGIDKVPQTGTWLLEKGERVMTQNTSARLDKMLEDLSKSMTPDQYAMKNIHPANQTTNNSNQESMTQNNITVHSAPITIQGNPDNKTIALIEQSQKKAIKEAIDVAAAQIIKGDGRLGNAMRGKYSGRKLD